MKFVLKIIKQRKPDRLFPVWVSSGPWWGEYRQWGSTDSEMIYMLTYFDCAEQYQRYAPWNSATSSFLWLFIIILIIWLTAHWFLTPLVMFLQTHQRYLLFWQKNTDMDGRPITAVGKLSLISGQIKQSYTVKSMTWINLQGAWWNMQACHFCFYTTAYYSCGTLGVTLSTSKAFKSSPLFNQSQTPTHKHSRPVSDLGV